MAAIKGGNKLSAKLTEMAGMLSGKDVVRIGFLENAKYPDGKSVAMIAAINEWGAPSRGQPPRPFFRSMIAKRRGEWPGAVAGLLKANNYDVKKTLQLTGEAVSGQLRQSIIDTNSPPLAPSTIAKKGHSKPLIDTSHMINSIDYEVKT